MSRSPSSVRRAAAAVVVDDLPRCKSLPLRPLGTSEAVQDTPSVTTAELARNAANPFRASLQTDPAERDVDDECPTLRKIPLGYREPDPQTEGAIIFCAGRHHAYAPGAKHLGAYTTHAHAQRRLDLYFGRKATLAATGVRVKPRGGE